MIRSEFAIFLIVGGLTVLVDYLAYRAVILTCLFETNLAKGAGFLTGTVFAYFANRHWTFGALTFSSGGAWRFAALYSLTLMCNVFANELMLSVLSGLPYPVQTAFVIATVISATLNFLGMKYFVFVSTQQGKAT